MGNSLLAHIDNQKRPVKYGITNTYHAARKLPLYSNMGIADTQFFIYCGCPKIPCPIIQSLVNLPCSFSKQVRFWACTAWLRRSFQNFILVISLFCSDYMLTFFTLQKNHKNCTCLLCGGWPIISPLSLDFCACSIFVYATKMPSQIFFNAAF